MYRMDCKQHSCQKGGKLLDKHGTYSGEKKRALAEEQMGVLLTTYAGENY